MKNSELNRILDKIDGWRDEIVADLQTLVQFESYQQDATTQQDITTDEPYGKQVALALDYMLERGVRFGMHTHNYDNRIGHIEIGGSGRVHGSKEADGELIAVLAHLDVVPPGNGWAHPPFGGNIVADDNGLMRMYGRGTDDDKGPAVASLYALRAIAETGTPLNNKRIRLLYGCDEEVGMSDVEHYTEVGEIPAVGFTPDASYPAIFAEKGFLTGTVAGRGVVDPDGDAGAVSATGAVSAIGAVAATGLPAIRIVSIDGGDKDNKVPEDCHCVALLGGGEVLSRVEAVLNAVSSELPQGTTLIWSVDSTRDTRDTRGGFGHTIAMHAQGVAAHAMNPEKGVNAIAIMLNTLARVFAAVGETNTFVDFFQQYYVGDVDRVELCDIRGKCVGVDHCDEPSGVLTWNTAIIRYNHQEPTQTDKTEFTFSIIHNIRYSVTLSLEHVASTITKTMEGFGAEGFSMEMTNDDHLKPLYIKKGTRLLNAVTDAYKGVTGDTAALPKASGGGTYARWFDNFVAIGFAIRNKESLAHQANEFIYIDDLIDSTKIYATAMYNLLNSDD